MPYRCRPFRFTTLLLATLVVAPGVVRAADTQWWTADTPSDYEKAESRGIVVRPDGTLELGPRAESARAESLTTVWAIAVLADGSVALAGDHGRIERWTESGGIRPWVKLPVGQVLSLAADGTGVVAGTGPEGLVYRVGAKGDTARLCATGEKYVWALAPAGGGGWFAATGLHGRLLRVQGGRATGVYDSDESNLVSMVADGHGGVYCGGDSKGRIVHVDARGAAHTVYDASEDEIRALAVGADGALYAAALSAAVATATADDEPTATPAASALTGARATVYRIVPDSVASIHWSSAQPFVHALLPRRDGLLVATGNRAAVYRVDRADAATLWLAAPQGQVTALAAAGERVLAATSNPAALWRLGPERAPRGELLSPALDARRIARFGRVQWRGEAGGAHVALFTRSGNSDPPDSAWTAWRGGAADDGGRDATAPPARYLQWRLELAGGTPRIESVEASWREQNLAPRVQDVSVSPQGRDVREGELVPRADPITQTLPGGQRVEYSLSTPPTPRQLRELPVWARGLRTVQWKGSDPNGDPLTYRLEARGERAGAGAGVPLADRLEAPTYTFDTHTLPDGRWRLRVIASDSGGNARGEDLSADAVSAPFTVDNTPPGVTQLDCVAAKDGIRVRGAAEDANSALSRIEVAVDGEAWRPVTPDGGFTDTRRLAFRTLLPAVAPGTHGVGVRVVDDAGNATTRATVVDVPAR